MRRQGQTIFLIEQMQPSWLKDITGVSAFHSLSIVAQLILIVVPLLLLFFANAHIMSQLQSIILPLGIKWTGLKPG
jgi:hypothetical protein